ncbi:hypothetical protein BaRGS_00017645 [Batillaria attramentaria]|uniref:Uncharacterized protein n=1 Tax=Batillaria attramentaria TaxID=370345 RepID=A0ABD0KUY0_9CAEN
MQCSDLSNVQGHETSAITEALVAVKEDLKEIHTGLETRTKELERSLTKVVNTNAHIEKKQQETKDTIKRKTNEWIAKLTEARDNALKSVDELVSEHQSKLKGTVLVFQKDIEKTKSLRVQVEQALGDERILLIARDTITNGLLNNEQLTDNMSGAPRAPSFEVNNESLQKMDENISLFLNSKSFLSPGDIFDFGDSGSVQGVDDNELPDHLNTGRSRNRRRSTDRSIDRSRSRSRSIDRSCSTI